MLLQTNFSYLSGAVAQLVQAGFEIRFPRLSPGRVYQGQEAVRVADLCLPGHGDFSLANGKVRSATGEVLAEVEPH
jgi:hypothetical protein